MMVTTSLTHHLHQPPPPAGTTPAAPLAPTIDLKRLLVRRVTLFAVVIGLLSACVVLLQAEERIRLHVSRAGSAVERAIASEVGRSRAAFTHSLERIEGLELKSLDGLGQLLGICVEVENIYKQRVIRRCFDDGNESPSVLRWILVRLTAADILYRGQIGTYAGVKVGEFIVTPNLDHESLTVWYQIRIVIGMTFGILLLNLLVYLPVQRMLRPTEQILGVLGRMEAGDIAVRMPRPGLLELRRIAMGFDHLAERLQSTLATQRQLAQRLISLREEERRHLARELHDEFGQCLTSIAADAAFIAASTRGSEEDRALAPAIRSITSVVAHMMESLQSILGQLRPLGLEEFGLQAALEHLLEGWQRRVPTCTFALRIDGAFDQLPDELTVSLYRIAQESVTNAMRHGSPGNVTVFLLRQADRCVLSIEDDGDGSRSDTSGSGLGVLGMSERVAALGGRFSIVERAPHGVRVQAEFPAEAMGLQGRP
jgi:two-component system sensor histidine kinase UhpB